MNSITAVQSPAETVAATAPVVRKRRSCAASQKFYTPDC